MSEDDLSEAIELVVGDLTATWLKRKRLPEGRELTSLIRHLTTTGYKDAKAIRDEMCHRNHTDLVSMGYHVDGTSIRAPTESEQAATYERGEDY